jgi:hypothetical protein
MEENKAKVLKKADLIMAFMMNPPPPNAETWAVQDEIELLSLLQFQHVDVVATAICVSTIQMANAVMHNTMLLPVENRELLRSALDALDAPG